MTSSISLRLLKPTGLPATGRAGLSLLEVILALAILSFATAYLAQSTRLATQNALSAQRTTQAELVAESVMNQVIAGVIPSQPVTWTTYYNSTGATDWMYQLQNVQSEVEGMVGLQIAVQQLNPNSGLVQSHYDLFVNRWIIDPVLELDTPPAESTEEQTSSSGAASSSGSGSGATTGASGGAASGAASSGMGYGGGGFGGGGFGGGGPGGGRGGAGGEAGGRGGPGGANGGRGGPGGAAGGRGGAAGGGRPGGGGAAPAGRGGGGGGFGPGGPGGGGGFGGGGGGNAGGNFGPGGPGRGGR